MLALRCGRPVPADLLCQGLWGEGEPPSAGKVLQTYISHLRRALPPGSVMTTTSGYALALDAEHSDGPPTEHEATFWGSDGANKAAQTQRQVRGGKG
jgi:hypothetical protein